MTKFLILFLSLTMMTGCSSFGKKWKAFLNEGEENPVAATRSQDGVVKFSDTKDIPVNSERQYRRMTKKQFEDQELFSDNAGSLWVNEGQDSYLFAQNIVRLPGDILNVVLDGQPQKQLSTKAEVIKELTNRIEKKNRGIASTDGKTTQNADAAKTKDSPKTAEEKKPDASATASAEKPNDENAMLSAGFDVKTIPTRIVERMSDGNYRVKGSQTFMIGSKEYKVIVTGMVKPQDIADDNVASSKMLDSRFDIVRGRGKTL